MNFKGFDVPKQNWYKMPNDFTDVAADIQTVAELKVVLYIMRHTWGFSEYDKPKKITIDEFENGRKRKDGSRMDKGCGLSKPSVVSGLKSARERGIIDVFGDDSDTARKERSYSIRMLKDLTADVKDFNHVPNYDVKSFNQSGKDSLHRTEKDTLEDTPSSLERHSLERDKGTCNKEESLSGGHIIDTLADDIKDEYKAFHLSLTEFMELVSTLLTPVGKGDFIRKPSGGQDVNNAARQLIKLFYIDEKYKNQDELVRHIAKWKEQATENDWKSYIFRVVDYAGFRHSNDSSSSLIHQQLAESAEKFGLYKD